MAYRPGKGTYGTYVLFVRSPTIAATSDAASLSDAHDLEPDVQGRLRLHRLDLRPQDSHDCHVARRLRLGSVVSQRHRRRDQRNDHGEAGWFRGDRRKGQTSGDRCNGETGKRRANGKRLTRRALAIPAIQRELTLAPPLLRQPSAPAIARSADQNGLGIRFLCFL